MCVLTDIYIYIYLFTWFSGTEVLKNWLGNWKDGSEVECLLWFWIPAPTGGGSQTPVTSDQRDLYPLWPPWAPKCTYTQN